MLAIINIIVDAGSRSGMTAYRLLTYSSFRTTIRNPFQVVAGMTHSYKYTNVLLELNIFCLLNGIANVITRRHVL